MRSTALALGVAVALAACSDSTTPDLFDDREVSHDIAASSGEAIAEAIATMSGNQIAGGLSSPASGDVGLMVTHNRTRTCYDAAGAVVQGCQPLSSVRSIVTTVSFEGNRAGTRTTTGGTTVSWTGTVDRAAIDTITRNFNSAQPPAETSRTHNGNGTAHDSTSFSDGSSSRTIVETGADSVRGVVFSLPRQSNPWPTAGTIVRNLSARVTITKANRTETRTLIRRVQVTFPADAQGNVALQINDRTCTLNLVTRRVSNCS